MGLPEAIQGWKPILLQADLAATCQSGIPVEDPLFRPSALAGQVRSGHVSSARARAFHNPAMLLLRMLRCPSFTGLTAIGGRGELKCYFNSFPSDLTVPFKIIQ